MKKVLAAFVCGVLFASGLAVSGMTNPNNIIGFLNVTGAWRPALMFVMIGAILVYAIAYRFIKKRSQPLFDNIFHLPTLDTVDKKLIVGSAIFGVGWGIGGFCPGPALTSLGAGAHDAMIFSVFMLAGMWAQKFWQASQEG